MRFNSGSSVKNNAYSASSASVDTNEKLKKLNEELDQLELLVSNMQNSLSSVNSKVGENSVTSQIALAKTEIENAIGQEVTTQKVTAPEAKLDVITSDTIHTDYISANENDSIDILNGIKVPNVKLSDAITSVSTSDNVRVPANAIAWIGSNIVVNKGNGNALIFSETGDISYYFSGSNILIHPTETVNVSFIYRSTPVTIIPHQSYEYTSVNSGLTVVGPFYADLTAATFQNITISNTLTAKDITAENISVSEDVNVTGTVKADKVESNSADIKEIESETITSDRVNSSQIHTKIDKENLGYTTIPEHQDTEEYTIGIPITNGLWEIELEGYIKATINKTNSAVLITYWRASESALTRVGVKDGVFYFYTRRSGKLYFSNNTLEVNDTTVSVNAPNDPGYPVPETLDKEINIVTNEGAIATETMVVDNLIVTGDFSIKDFVADKVAVRITDEDQDFNVTFTAPLPDPEQEEVSNNYIYGDSDLTYNPTSNTLGTGSIKVEKDITLVDSVDAETEEVTYSSGEAYQYLSVSCAADGETLRAHWEDAATTISCENPKLTSSQTIAAYNGKTAENTYPITHLGTCTKLHGNMGDGYLCLEDARLYSPALYAGANTVCRLLVDGICNPKLYDRTTYKCHDVASWVCEAPATSTWNSVVCNNGVCKKLTTTDHVKAACVTACDTVLACCHLESRGDLTVAGKTHISGDLYVDGTTHYVDMETSTIQDDTLVLRTNAQVGLGYDKVSGIVVNKYNGTDSLSMVTDCTGTMRVGTGTGTDTCYPAICYNNDDKKWYINDVETSVSGNLTSWATKNENDPYTEYTDAIFTTINLTSLEPVLTRAEASDLTNDLPLVWDSTNTKAVTSDEAVVKYESTALPNDPVNKLYGITESVAITNMKLKDFALKYFELSGNNYVPRANTLSTSLTIGSDTDVNVTTISSDFSLINGTISTTKSTRVTGTVNTKKFYIGETTNCKYYNVGSGDGNGSAVSIDDNSSSACTYNIIQTCDDELYCSCNLTYVPSTGTLYAPNLTSCCICSIASNNSTSYTRVISNAYCIQLCRKGGIINEGSINIGGYSSLEQAYPVRLYGEAPYYGSEGVSSLCLGSTTTLQRLDDRPNDGFCFKAFVQQVSNNAQCIGVHACRCYGSGCPNNYIFDAYDVMQAFNGDDYHYQRTVRGTTEFISCHKYNNTTGRFQVCCNATKGWLNYVTEDEIASNEIKASKTSGNICYCSSATAHDNGAVEMHAYRCNLTSSEIREGYASLAWDGFYLTCVPFCQQEGNSSTYNCAIIGNGCNIWESQDSSICAPNCVKTFRCGTAGYISDSVREAYSNGCLCCGTWANMSQIGYDVTSMNCNNGNRNYAQVCVTSGDFSATTCCSVDCSSSQLFVSPNCITGWVNASCNGAFRLYGGAFQVCNSGTSNCWANVLTACDAGNTCMLKNASDPNYCLCFEDINELNLYGNSRLWLNYRGGAGCVTIGNGAGTGCLGALSAGCLNVETDLCVCSKLCVGYDACIGGELHVCEGIYLGAPGDVCIHDLCGRDVFCSYNGNIIISGNRYFNGAYTSDQSKILINEDCINIGRTFANNCSYGIFVCETDDYIRFRAGANSASICFCNGNIICTTAPYLCLNNEVRANLLCAPTLCVSCICFI